MQQSGAEKKEQSERNSRIELSANTRTLFEVFSVACLTERPATVGDVAVQGEGSIASPHRLIVTALLLCK